MIAIVNLLRTAIPSWVSVVAVLGVVGGYTGWVMYKQHAHDEVKYDAAIAREQKFVTQVGDIGKAALAANARAAEENRAKLEKMEKDHEDRENRIKDGASKSDQRNRAVISALRLRLAAPGGGPGGGSTSAAADPAKGADGVECYDAGELEQRVRGSMVNFLGRASGIVRRGEEAEALVDLCRAFALDLKPISPPLK